MESRVPIVKILPQVPDNRDPVRWLTITLMCLVSLMVLIAFVALIGF